MKYFSYTKKRIFLISYIDSYKFRVYKYIDIQYLNYSNNAKIQSSSQHLFTYVLLIFKPG